MLSVEKAVSGGQGVVVRSRRCPARCASEDPAPKTRVKFVAEIQMQGGVMAKLRAENIVAHGGLAEALMHLYICILLLDRQ
jgi:hypothetical protein